LRRIVNDHPEPAQANRLIHPQNFPGEHNVVIVGKVLPSGGEQLSQVTAQDFSEAESRFPPAALTPVRALQRRIAVSAGVHNEVLRSGRHGVRIRTAAVLTVTPAKAVGVDAHVGLLSHGNLLRDGERVQCETIRAHQDD
jgi:hypothetical protein